MRTHVHVTPEIRERSREWLEQPLPEDLEAFEDTLRDLDDIVGTRRPVALVEEVEAAE